VEINNQNRRCILEYDCNIKTLNKNELIIGNLIMIKVIINEIDFTKINIYRPNDDNIYIFYILEKFILEHDDNGSDFNTVINTTVDKKNRHLHTSGKCRDKIEI
jgi:hypothetical protein